MRATALGFLLLCPFLLPSNQLLPCASCRDPPTTGMYVCTQAYTSTHIVHSFPLCICPSPAQTIWDPVSCEEYWGQCLVTCAD